LAIGKEGQNVRLAARLTGWKIDIKDTNKYDHQAEQEKVLAQITQERQQAALEEEEDELEELEELEKLEESEEELKNLA